MHDPNTLRTHYHRASQRRARQKRIRAAFRWLALWLLVSLVGVSLALG